MTELSSGQINIGGDVSQSQLAQGNYNLQLSVHGGVVNLVAADFQPKPRRRTIPVDLRPRPIRDFLDRQDEVDTVTAGSASDQIVEFYGQAGIGKTSLLRHLAHHPIVSSCADGVVYCLVRNQSFDDAKQSLYDAFHECDVPYIPGDTEFHHAMRSIRSLILLDDVDWDRDDLEHLLDAVPNSRFVLTCRTRKLWRDGESLKVDGLPPSDALDLFTKHLCRPLTDQELREVQHFCHAIEGHPLRIVQVAGQLRAQSTTIHEAVAELAASKATILKSNVDSRSDDERRMLGILAVLGGAFVSLEQLAAMTGVEDAEAIVTELHSSGLVQRLNGQCAISANLQEALHLREFTSIGKTVLGFFESWTNAHRHDPDDLLDQADAILAVLEWGVHSRQWSAVLAISRAVEGAFAIGKRWSAWGQVLEWAEKASQQLEEKEAEAWALHQRGSLALCLGSAAPAKASLSRALKLRESLGDVQGAEVTRHNLDVLLGGVQAVQESGSSQPPTTHLGSTIFSTIPSSVIALVGVSALSLIGLVAYSLLKPQPSNGTPAALRVQPSAVIGGHTATATLDLAGEARADGVVVTLSSERSDIAYATSESMTIPVGQRSATFEVQTLQVTRAEDVILTASVGVFSKETRLRVEPKPRLDSLKLSPKSASENATVTGTVTFSGLVRKEAAVVELSAFDATDVTLPNSVSVSIGETSATFELTIGTVTERKTVTIQASHQDEQKQAELFVVESTKVEPVTTDNTNSVLRRYRPDDLTVSASSTSTYYPHSWPPTRAFDGKFETSWFSARRDAAAFGKQPWVQIAFPKGITVRRVTALGNREPDWYDGYSIRSARIELRDASEEVLQSQTNEGIGNRHDFDFRFNPAVSGVRFVRFISLADEGDKNRHEETAIAEVQIE